MLHSPIASTEQGMIELLEPIGNIAANEVQSGNTRQFDPEQQGVGFLDNGKFNVAPLFANLEELLSQTRFSSVGARIKKPITSKPTPDKLLSELARQCHLVINGVGD
ncbi:hypothetical protein ANRL2_04413 [Anaerolineae bacterium]|nr:hypothetical protein ANRL2_04413 [Anaerolineae bacterium]